MNASTSIEFTLIPSLKNFLISNESGVKQDNRKPLCGLFLFRSEVATANVLHKLHFTKSNFPLTIHHMTKLHEDSPVYRDLPRTKNYIRPLHLTSFKKLQEVFDLNP